MRYDSEKSTISQRAEQLANKTQFFDTGIEDKEYDLYMNSRPLLQ